MNAVYQCFFGSKYSEEYLVRLHYLVEVSKYELIESSLSVFVAAGISSAAMTIIDTISDSQKSVECGITLIYACFWYLMGKSMSYNLRIY
jgi:hypothetical protein